MGGSTSSQRTSQEEQHQALVAVPRSHCFDLSEHLLSDDAAERRDGRLFRIRGGGARTVLQLDLPTAQPHPHTTRGQQASPRNWWADLRGQVHSNRTIEVRLTFALADAAREIQVRKGSYTGTGYKWPRAVFFDAELDRHTLNEMYEVQMNSLPQTTTVRYEKVLGTLSRDAAVTLVVKPEFTNSFLRQSMRIVFQGDASFGDSFVRIRSSPWERLTLPPTYDPRQDPGHECIANGVPLCQGGPHGRHFEYVPLDEGESLALASNWHLAQEGERARALQAEQQLGAQLDESKIQRLASPPLPVTPSRNAFQPSPSVGFDRDWNYETVQQLPAQTTPARSVLPVATMPMGGMLFDQQSLVINSTRPVTQQQRSQPQHQGQETDDGDDDDPFLVHASPPVPTAEGKRRADTDLYLLRPPLSSTLRSPTAVPAPIPADGQNRLRPGTLPPLSIRMSPDVSAQSSPRGPPPQRPDLHVHVSNTPMPTPKVLPLYAAPPASSSRNRIAPLPHQAPSPRGNANTGGPYDPFSATFAQPQGDPIRGGGPGGLGGLGSTLSGAPSRQQGFFSGPSMAPYTPHSAQPFASGLQPNQYYSSFAPQQRTPGQLPGDLNIIVPKKFLAFAGPHSTNLSPEGYPTLTPADYVPIFKVYGVETVIVGATSSSGTSQQHQGLVSPVAQRTRDHR